MGIKIWQVKLIKKIISPGEFIVIAPSGITGESKKYWDNFFKGYLASDQARKDAEADLTILRSFSAHRIKNNIEKQLWNILHSNTRILI